VKVILKVIGIFLLVLVGFSALGYYFYNKSENAILFLICSHIGLVLGIYFAKKSIPKKTIPHKSSEIIS
jgi:FtsH-binding integral membrane protein